MKSHLNVRLRNLPRCLTTDSSREEEGVGTQAVFLQIQVPKVCWVVTDLYQKEGRGSPEPTLSQVSAWQNDQPSTGLQSRLAEGPATA